MNRTPARTGDEGEEVPTIVDFDVTTDPIPASTGELVPTTGAQDPDTTTGDSGIVLASSFACSASKSP